MFFTSLIIVAMVKRFESKTPQEHVARSNNSDDLPSLVMAKVSAEARNEAECWRAVCTMEMLD